MKTNNDTSARVQTFTFDNGELRFSIDCERVARSIFPEGEYDTGTFDSLITVSLKTLIHRTTSRPKVNDVDATDWLIEALTGGEAGGRFRVTAKDKERAANVLKAHKMAPEQTEKLFKDTYKMDFNADEEWLTKHYMGVRAAKAAAEKAEMKAV